MALAGLIFTAITRPTRWVMCLCIDRVNDDARHAVQVFASTCSMPTRTGQFAPCGGGLVPDLAC
eukprot:353919-Chlamydomonas_euryale.AAC.3